MANGHEKRLITIKRGTEVDAVYIRSMAPEDKKACKRIHDKHLKDNPKERLVFFKYEGVIRVLVIGEDLVPAKLRRQTWER